MTSMPRRNATRRSRVYASSMSVLGFGLAMLLCGTAGNVEAQVGLAVTTQPQSPTSATPVTILIFNICGCPMYRTPIVRDGFTFDVPYGEGCLSACLATTTPYTVGLLEPGTYTVRQFLEDDPGSAEVIGTFVVAAATAPIPTLDVGGAAALAIALTLMSLVVLRRLT